MPTTGLVPYNDLEKVCLVIRMIGGMRACTIHMLRRMNE